MLRNTNFRPQFFDPAAEKAALPGLTPHEPRHTAASPVVAAGANIKAVQQVLGHVFWLILWTLLAWLAVLAVALFLFG